MGGSGRRRDLRKVVGFGLALGGDVVLRVHLPDAQLGEHLVELGGVIGRQKAAGVVEHKTGQVNHQAAVAAAELGLSCVEQPIQNLGYNLFRRRAAKLTKVPADLLLGGLLVRLGHVPTVPPD